MRPTLPTAHCSSSIRSFPLFTSALHLSPQARSHLSNSNPSRRLALLQLGTAIPQAQLLSVGTKFAGAQESLIEVNTNGSFPRVSPTVSEEGAAEWVQKDKRRMLHAVCCVGDLDRTIEFYTECLGMTLLRRRDIPEERFSNAFVGYGPENSHFAIELTYNYGVDKYDVGTGFGHFGIAVADIAKTLDLVKSKRGKVIKEPEPMEGGSSLVAFIEDPDGYRFKLSEKKLTPEPFHQVMLQVGDIDRSVRFYQKAFGMELMNKTENPAYNYASATLGYGPEDRNAVLELTYNYGVTEYNKGNAYVQIALGTDDVYKTAEAINLFGGKITREPGPLPGINTKITVCLDPDGWKSAFVDNIDFAKELQ